MVRERERKSVVCVCVREEREREEREERVVICTYTNIYIESVYVLVGVEVRGVELCGGLLSAGAGGGGGRGRRAPACPG